jgi:hypothetical protein
MPDSSVVESIRRKFDSLSHLMDERARRCWAAAEAMELGWGGVSAVSLATSMSRTTITEGIKQLRRGDYTAPEADGRIRRLGGGRKPVTETDPELLGALERLVDPLSRGDPQSPLRWTLKSTQRLARELTSQNHPVGARTVAALLRKAGYSLLANRKTREGAQHPDRNRQFEYINDQVRRFQHCGQPAISVDTKKKELVGDFKNAGRQWRPKDNPEQVRVHDFKDKDLGKAIPYGVYDMLNNQGWVSVGIDHDTAQFATRSILLWWTEMGSARFPHARRLLITADGGGSNSHRSRLWKLSLQELANETGLKLVVCHFPPGTSKWNKIEHRLFSYITQNWQGEPLATLQTIVELIGSTTTKGGLKVRARLDTKSYETGIKVTDEELAAVKLERHETHGSWNYTIKPSK